ncbi:MAG TPA: large-conductance mechanosensitive channel protein MscL [Mucilaginibacter sp.]|nr:large-conductance mechanosensitive channel protein MscL [Mucilaginibacter sp.]
MSVVKEFKEFAVKGNVIDLAVGVVIGAAFGRIVTSLVTDIMLPPLGILTGGVDFSDMKLVIKAADVAKKTAAVSINYGNFINILIQFIIIAFCIFLVVKGINSMKKKEEAPSAAPAPTNEEVLLTEIRDLLAKGK